ncbi:ATP-binding protein [Antarcticibacterium flavum]|uniref:ATP-binding protein n=2 Tax=Antarcticibacterium TaxID=2058174 RepID=A0A5B7X3Q8_9FLAO|nr:ATP-binding protein [Antarcticibacterium flavum]MCM4161582.1 hypothetical protein [Antarcticibacterium sp. W02-3]QCY70017.1 ATP-binding protein [Antarcticibacterium flavum]
MVILVIGLPGSGKSFFAERLAQKIGADYYNSDRLRKEIFFERTYSDSEKEKVYNALLKKMKEATNKGKDVVVDATFYKDKFRKLFTTNGGERIAFIKVWANEKLTKDRIQKKRKFSEADFDVYKLLKRQWEPVKQPHLILESTNENIDAMLQKAEDYLKDDKRTN